MRQELCNTVDGLFDPLCTKFHLQHNQMIKPLQYCKLSRQYSAKADEWIGRLRIAVDECNYKELGD